MDYSGSVYSYFCHNICDYFGYFGNEVNMIVAIDVSWSSFKYPDEFFNLMFELWGDLIVLVALIVNNGVVKLIFSYELLVLN